MKATILLAVYLVSVLSNENKPTGHTPSSGVFKTKEDFINNRVSYSSPYEVKRKFIFYWRSLHYSVYADEPVYLKLSDENKIRIRPDSIFAFTTNGIRYIYSAHEEKYLAVLHDKLPLLLVMDVVSHIGYRYYSASAKLLYTKDINLPLKEFTLDNIQSDFGNNAELLPSLINLFKFLAKEKKYLDVYSHEEFFRCREAIGKFL